jgi:SAM-dependent methyltransferase
VLSESIFSSNRPQLPRTNGSVTRCIDLGCGRQSIFKHKKIADVCIEADRFTAESSLPSALFKGEQFPFSDCSFDLVICRVSLPYMHIPKALREIRRVLRLGGRLWATLHLPKIAAARIWKSVTVLDFVDAAFQSCASANNLLLVVLKCPIGISKTMCKSSVSSDWHICQCSLASRFRPNVW